MAKRLIIAFDVVDENDNSIIDWQCNTNEIDISDDVTPLDITRLWMDMYRYTMYAPAHPGISHLFPYMAPLIEEAQGCKSISNLLQSQKNRTSFAKPET